MTYKIQIDDTVREATPEEAVAIDAQRALGDAEAVALEATRNAAAAARAKLAALGLTEAEIKALVG
jgi:hypothetical protein